MKRIGLVLLGSLLVLAVNQSFAQVTDNPFEEFVRENATELVGSVADPFTKVFSTAVTGGIYRSAATHGLLGFDVGVRGMFVLIPTGKSSVFDTVDVALFPLPVAQASLGLPMDTEVMVRGFAVKYKGTDVSLLGIGLKKNFKPLIPIPMFPDVAAMISYHRFKGSYTTFQLSEVPFADLGLTPPPTGWDATFDAGNLMSSTHWSFDLIVSKKFSLVLISFQPYVGLGWDRSSMDYEWTILETQPAIPDSLLSLPMIMTGGSDVSSTRLTLGLDVSPFPFVHVFGDYNFGKFPQATAGLAISFR